MKRVIAIAVVLVLGLMLFGCTGQSASDKQSGSSEQSSTTQTVDKNGSIKEAGEIVKKELNFSKGTHHVEMLIKGYRAPIEIEIYSNSAPRTAAKFCELVKSKYYNGKPMFWILDDMFVKIGNTEQDNNYLITGEYKESGFKNSNSLKKGIIALSRAEDGQQSDASSFIIFLSDVSYLDGKYAAFGKVTKGMDLIVHLAELTQAPEESQKIYTDENGRITDEKQCPVIRSITIID